MDIHHLCRRPWVVYNFGVASKLTSGLGSASLTAALRQAGINAQRVNLAGQELPDDVTMFAPHGAVVGFHTMSGLPLERCLSVAHQFRARRPDVTIIWGGPACTFYGESIAASGLADIIVQGDGEPFAWAVGRGTCVDLEFHQVAKSIVIRTSVVSDMDSLPLLPQWLPPEELVYPYDRFGVSVAAYDIQLSRGCWGKCRFCYVGNSGYRCRSASHLQKELALVTDREIDFVRFLDDTFPLTADVIETLEDWVARCGRPVMFFCELRLEHLAKTKLLKSFCNIGLRDVFIGAESGDPAELAELGKPIAIDTLPSCVSLLRSFGVGAFVGFLLNLPGQTQKRLENTLRLAVATDAEAYYPVFARRYPGLDLQESPVHTKPTLDDIARDEWLDLSANCTVDVSDQCLVDALVKLKTLPLVKRALTTPLCRSASCLIPADKRYVYVDNARLCIHVAKAKSVHLSAENLCSHPHCNAVLLWATAAQDNDNVSWSEGIALQLANDSHYLVRSLALWVLWRRPVLSLACASSAMEYSRSLLNDSHALVRSLAKLLYRRLAKSHE